MARNEEQLFDIDIYTDVWNNKISIMTNLRNGTIDIKDKIPMPELESLWNEQDESKYNQLNDKIDAVRVAYETKLVEISKVMKTLVEGMHVQYVDEINKMVKELLK
jgi:hypothetical protein